MPPENTLALLYENGAPLTEDQAAALADYWDDDESFEENVAAAERWLEQCRKPAE
jgi:predicted DNA-binding protein YlxM (UPF0122 family)